MSSEKIVVIGGGTGSYTALMGLKRHTKNLTAVVTMADDGGSSGRLRDELGHLPQGDVRRCLVALSANRRINRLLRDLFEYRFDRGQGLRGHSFGNLFLAALTEITGSTEQAILYASQLLNVKGHVLPVTTDNVRLGAELEDGTFILGERNIDVRVTKPHLKIRNVFLSPRAGVYPPAADAIRNADILVIGPGDLYSSVIANLLVGGVPEAIQECQGVRIYVCNLMTKKGETDGFAASDFVEELLKYIAKPGSLDYMIVNKSNFSPAVAKRYAEEGAFPIVADVERCQRFVPRVLVEDMAVHGNLVRHDHRKLSEIIFKYARPLLLYKQSHSLPVRDLVTRRNVFSARGYAAEVRGKEANLENRRS